MAKSTRRARRGVRGDVMEMWQAPKQSLPAQIVGIVMRWRVELLLVAVLVIGMVWLSSQLGTWGAWFTLAGVVLLGALVPWTRRFVVSRFWCVLDRHRIRTCLRNAKYRTMTLDGSYPFMVWARPSRTGERIWMWTRAGSSAEDLENVLEKLAPACFAREARLHTRRSLSTLVVVEIIRRDPLDKTAAVTSPLAKVTALLPGTKQPGEGTEPITGATVTPLPVTDKPATDGQASADKPAKTTSKAKTTSNAAATTTPTAVVGGEDLSDYI